MNLNINFVDNLIWAGLLFVLLALFIFYEDRQGSTARPWLYIHPVTKTMFAILLLFESIIGLFQYRFILSLAGLVFALIFLRESKESWGRANNHYRYSRFSNDESKFSVWWRRQLSNIRNRESLRQQRRDEKLLRQETIREKAKLLAQRELNQDVLIPDSEES